MFIFETMNKKIFTGLIVLMGISIVGVIIIQLIWMNNAIHVRNELFDRSVNDALNSTTNRLETMQDFRMINHFAFDDTLFLRQPEPPEPPFLPPSQNHPGYEPESARDGKGFRYHFRPDGPDENPDSLTNFNPDSVAHDLNKIYAHGIRRFDSIVDKFDYRTDTTGSMKRFFDFKTRRLKWVANQAVREISDWGEELPFERVKEVLSTELFNRNIPISFEMGIIKDSKIYSKSLLADSLLLKKSNYKVNLYPGHIFQKNVNLAVYFPGKETFIYKTLNWLLLISLIFSVVILVTFAASIYFILKQKKISEMKSDFINNMTHEFKTPIATISVAADLISNPKIIENPDRIRYFAEMIKKEDLRMNRQVEDILTIARLDKKDFEFKWEAFDLHEVIENAIQSILLQVEKKGGTITSELLAVNPVATSDVSHFANMIYNLLDNANKYSLCTPEIRITTRNTGKGVIVAVFDKGIGMNRVVQSRIFERFYRQTSGNIQNVKGFGLGLSYVKAVLEANRGTIVVHSEPGKGSCFEVFIPFVRE
jgi:two-component system, OmpR family, phosphate regulon sensor histidine kinase PhoR